MLEYLAARATPGVESVDPESGVYTRSVKLDGRAGFIVVRHAANSGRSRSAHRARALQLDLSAGLVPALVPLIARVRRLFDLDADPATIDAHLAKDATLAPRVARRPGLRVTGALDGFELALRAVLGQQVSVRGASTLAGRLATLAGEPLSAPGLSIDRLPVSSERLADLRPATVGTIGLTRARAECLVALARATAAGELPELTHGGPADPLDLVQRLEALPGIGPWTAQYIAMRALGWPDAFPASDLGLRNAMGGISAARLRAASEAWRPWRAYAAQHLWASLRDEPRTDA
jgi:AraC family transcriptional regulator of adaptative response / DNA-3-methyladenine glycosylase II